MKDVGTLHDIYLYTSKSKSTKGAASSGQGDHAQFNPRNSNHTYSKGGNSNKKAFNCSHHGANYTHDTKDCQHLKKGNGSQPEAQKNTKRNLPEGSSEGTPSKGGGTSHQHKITDSFPPKERTKCEYKPCQKPGHTIDTCFLKQRHDKEAAAAAADSSNRSARALHTMHTDVNQAFSQEVISIMNAIPEHHPTLDMYAEGLNRVPSHISDMLASEQSPGGPPVIHQSRAHLSTDKSVLFGTSETLSRLLPDQRPRIFISLPRYPGNTIDHTDIMPTAAADDYHRPTGTTTTIKDTESITDKGPSTIEPSVLQETLSDTGCDAAAIDYNVVMALNIPITPMQGKFTFADSTMSQPRIGVTAKTPILIHFAAPAKAYNSPGDVLPSISLEWSFEVMKGIQSNDKPYTILFGQDLMQSTWSLLKSKGYNESSFLPFTIGLPLDTKTSKGVTGPVTNSQTPILGANHVAAVRDSAIKPPPVDTVVPRGITYL